jgi:hypothetical protein
MNMIFAYIDVALGSMILQAMAGMVLAGVVMGRRALLAPLAWFRKSANDESEGNTQEFVNSPTDSK